MGKRPLLFPGDKIRHRQTVGPGDDRGTFMYDSSIVGIGGGATGRFRFGIVLASLRNRPCTDRDSPAASDESFPAVLYVLDSVTCQTGWVWNDSVSEVV